MRESMVFSEPVSRPTSVFESISGRRADKSPSAILAAVSSILLSGRRLRRISNLDIAAIRNRTINEIKKNSAVSLFKVRSTLSRATETTTVPTPEGNSFATTRTSGASPSLWMVNGCP